MHDLLEWFFSLFRGPPPEPVKPAKPAAPVRKIKPARAEKAKMAKFKIALAHVFGKEGGYSNRRSDRGGETIFGISRKRHPTWPGWKIVDLYHPHSKAAKDPRVKQLAKPFYQKEFWGAINGDAIQSQAVANECFDTIVNQGPISKKGIQRSCNNMSVTPRGKKLFKDLKVDGAIGTKTINAIKVICKAGGLDVLLKQLDIQQGTRYNDIIKHDQAERKKGKRKKLPDQRINMWGWLRHRIGLA